MVARDYLPCERLFFPPLPGRPFPPRSGRPNLNGKASDDRYAAIPGDPPRLLQGATKRFVPTTTPHALRVSNVASQDFTSLCRIANCGGNHTAAWALHLSGNIQLLIGSSDLCTCILPLPLQQASLLLRQAHQSGAWTCLDVSVRARLHSLALVVEPHCCLSIQPFPSRLAVIAVSSLNAMLAPWLMDLGLSLLTVVPGTVWSSAIMYQASSAPCH